LPETDARSASRRGESDHRRPVATAAPLASREARSQPSGPQSARADAGAPNPSSAPVSIACFAAALGTPTCTDQAFKKPASPPVRRRASGTA
jgi:hypothetical protein